MLARPLVQPFRRSTAGRKKKRKVMELKTTMNLGGSALSARRVPGAGRVVQPDFPCPGKDECGPRRNPGKASGRHGAIYSLTETMGLAVAVGGRNRCPVIMPLVVPKAATSQATSRPA